MARAGRITFSSRAAPVPSIITARGGGRGRVRVSPLVLYFYKRIF